MLFFIKIMTTKKVQRKSPSLRYDKCMQLDTKGLDSH